MAKALQILLLLCLSCIFAGSSKRRDQSSKGKHWGELKRQNENTEEKRREAKEHKDLMEEKKRASIRMVKEKDFVELFNGNVGASDDDFTYLIEQANHSFGAFTTMIENERVVIFFDTVASLGPTSLSQQLSNQYKAYHMVPAFEMNFLNEREEELINSYNSEPARKNGEEKKKTIYFDAKGRSYARTILNPVIQKNMDDTCQQRTRAALLWMKENKSKIRMILQEAREMEITIDGADIWGKEAEVAPGMVCSLEEKEANRFDQERQERIQKDISKQDPDVKFNPDNSFELIEIFFFLKNYGGPFKSEMENRGMKFYNGRDWEVTARLESEQRLENFQRFFQREARQRAKVQVVPFPKEFKDIQVKVGGGTIRISDYVLTGKLEKQAPSRFFTID